MPKPDPERERHWRAIIADSTASGLSHAEYCRRHNINVMHLRNWMKRLKQRDAVAAKSHPGEQPKGSRSGRRAAKRANRKPRTTDRPLLVDPNCQVGVEFAEVRLVDTEEPAATQHSIAGPLEIVLSSGLTVRMAHGAPLDTLSSLITVLENR